MEGSGRLVEINGERIKWPWRGSGLGESFLGARTKEEVMLTSLTF